MMDTSKRTPKKKLFTPSAPSRPLTPMKLNPLEWIGKLGFVTADQLAILCNKSVDTTRGHLRDLFDMELTRRTSVPRAALTYHGNPDTALLYGSAPMIYSLSKTGVNLLQKLDRIEVHEAEYRPKLGPTHSLFIAHELAIRDVRCWLEQIKRYEHHEGVQWWRQGVEAGIILEKAGDKERVYAPDAVFEYQLPRLKLIGLVEVDRGSERAPSRWRDKCRNYAKIFGLPNDLARGRMIVWVPAPARRDAIGRIVAESLPKEMAERVWITDTLPKSFSDPVWRVPGRPMLHPFV